MVTRSDVASVLGLERQKQLLGCSQESNSCMAELAGALGVADLITGQVAKVGKHYGVILRILQAGDAKVLFSESLTADDEEGVLTAYEGLARRVEAALLGEPSVGPESSGAPVRWAPWAAVGAGVLAAAGGGVLLWQSGVQYQNLVALPTGDNAVKQATTAAGTGKAEWVAGWALVGTGAAAVAGGLLWYFLDRELPPVALTPVHGGAVISWEGTW